MMLSIEDTWSSTMPKIAVSGNDVHVVWAQQDYGLVYRRSTNGGSTWQNITPLIPQLGYSSIQAFGDTVYVVGAGGSTASLRFVKSYNRGSSWLPIVTITPASNNPTVRIVAHNTAHIVASYARQGEVYSVRSLDHGETWSDSQMVSEYGVASQWPAMDTDDSGGVHVRWFDYKYSPYPWTGDIFYRASRDSGNSWEDIDPLTVQHRAVDSDILTESTNLHLVWEDDRYDFNHNFEIFYRMSTDLGYNWQSEERLTDTLNWSCGPSLACDGQYLHLFWFDLRDDSSNSIGEIYYKRKDLSVPIHEERSHRLTSCLDVYPNPFTTDVMLRITDGRYKEISNVRLFDISGTEVIAVGVKNKTGEMRVDTSNLPCGVYFVRIKAGNATAVEKVVKIQ